MARPQRLPLDRQVVVITGASSGLGRCAALHMAAEGAAVVMTARSAAALDELAAQIQDAGGRAIAVPGDVTSRADLEAVRDAALDRYGRIDSWINNAGVYIQGRVQDLDLDEYRRVLDVNLVGVVNGTQRALEAMLPREEGVIVQVASVAGPRGVPLIAPYSAAKAGIDGFNGAVRAEFFGRGISISTLYPQTMDTPVFRHARGKLGVVPKPAPPVVDPARGAHALAELAMTGRRSHYLGWAAPLVLLDALAPSAADWLLYHVEGLTYSDIPSTTDNLDAPAPPYTVRDGWGDRGIRGVTFRETVRVLPWESLAAALSLGFLLGRTFRSR